MSTTVQRFSRKDWLIFAAFVVVGFGLRFPMRSQLPFHWDSAQFAIAIQQYDIRLSQPHAPGYFLYVLAGRLVNLLLGDPHASLVWISLISGSMLVGLMYLLGTSLFNQRVGLAAGCLTVTSPLVWFNSCVALTYVPDACLCVLFVLIVWRAMQWGGGWGWTVTLGVLGAVIAGVRPQTAPTLLPVGLWMFWNFKRQRWQQLLVAGCVAGVLIGLWLVPMLQTSGGLTVFRQIVRLAKETHAHETVLGGGGLKALSLNIAHAALFCWTGLFLGVIAVAAGLVYRVTAMADDRRQQWNQLYGRSVRLWAIWVVPMMVFGTVLALTRQPGYVLNYLPGLILLVAVALDHLRSRASFMACTASLVLVNAVIFTSWPINWHDHLGSFWYTSSAIRRHDEQLASMIHSVRARFNPTQTVLYHDREYLLFGFRQFQYALPEFNQYQLEIDHTLIKPPGRPMWRARGGRLEFVSGPEPMTPPRTVLLVVPPLQTVAIFGKYFSIEHAREVQDSQGRLYEWHE